jgi:hypothetical protein
MAQPPASPPAAGMLRHAASAKNGGDESCSAPLQAEVGGQEAGGDCKDEGGVVGGYNRG